MCAYGYSFVILTDNQEAAEFVLREQNSLSSTMMPTLILTIFISLLNSLFPHDEKINDGVKQNNNKNRCYFAERNLRQVLKRGTGIVIDVEPV